MKGIQHANTIIIYKPVTNETGTDYILPPNKRNQKQNDDCWSRDGLHAGRGYPYAVL